MRLGTGRPILRRTLLELVHLFNERMDMIVRMLAIALVLSLLLHNVLHVSEMVERVLTFFHFIVAFGVVAYFLARKVFLKDSTRIWSLVLTDEDCRRLRDWLRTGKGPAARGCPCLTDFASPALLETLVDMNYIGFKDTAFAVDREQLMRRNLAWITKNPRIFMLMRDPIFQKDYIGYSALVPLNPGGADLYLKSRLKDADIPDALISGPDERPVLVLLFAVVLKEEFSFSRTGASRQYSYYFWGCIEKHVRELYPDLFHAGDYPPLYAQAERIRMRHRLKSMGFKPSGIESADGFDLWVLEVPGATVQQQEARTSTA